MSSENSVLFVPISRESLDFKGPRMYEALEFMMRPSILYELRLAHDALMTSNAQRACTQQCQSADEVRPHGRYSLAGLQHHGLVFINDYIGVVAPRLEAVVSRASGRGAVAEVVYGVIRHRKRL